MKKKIILVVLAVALLLGAVPSGVAYATNGHQMVYGQKLIGVGWYGATDPDISTPVPEGVSIYCFFTVFSVTNPNCDRPITIKNMSIIDENGEVVYEWIWENEPFELSPHETWQFCLWEYVEPPLIPREGEEFAPMFTVEITWGGSVTRPLTGWFKQFYHMEDNMGDGNYLLDTAMSEAQMVNFADGAPVWPVRPTPSWPWR